MLLYDVAFDPAVGNGGTLCMAQPPSYGTYKTVTPKDELVIP